MKKDWGDKNSSTDVFKQGTFGISGPKNTLVQWLSLLPHSKKVLVEQSAGWDPSVGNLHVPPVSVWVSSKSSGFLPQPKDVQARFTGGSKLPVCVNVFMNVCFSLSGSPMMNW